MVNSDIVMEAKGEIGSVMAKITADLTDSKVEVKAGGKGIVKTVLGLNRRCDEELKFCIKYLNKNR